MYTAVALSALVDAGDFPEHPGGTGSGWLIVRDSFAAAPGTVSIGASAGHLI
jgi:hypothetical protein